MLTSKLGLPLKTLPRLIAGGFAAALLISACADGGEGDRVCGDGEVQEGEGCDDGNTVSGDGCTATCADESLCGNNALDAGEECDDGNRDGGDGCAEDCTNEGSATCGDGVLAAGEACDDGNDIPYDGCEADCTLSPDEVSCGDLPAGNGTCQVTAGGDATLISGVILAEHTILRGGQVLVDAMGKISCMGCDCSTEGAGATAVTCPTGVVSPGLINGHDHITFIQNDPYNDTGERYEHRHDWRRGKNGHTEIGASGGASTNAKHWGELRFVMGGATSTIGSGDVFGLLRNLDRSSQEGLGQEEVEYSTFPLDDSDGTQLVGSCSYGDLESASFVSSKEAYFPHVAEGIDGFARNEFLCLSSTENGGEDLVQPQSAFIHAVGLNPLDYAQMAADGASIIWSPRSNITLYGDTAAVNVADRLGVNIALGTDWMPTGSMNMLREIQCADGWNRDQMGGYFTDRQLWHMATLNAAKASATDDVIGVLREGHVADIAIFDGAVNTDHRAVIDAGVDDVVLVMRSGQALYGDDAVVAGLSGGSNCDTLDVCSRGKRVCLQAEISTSLASLQGSVGSLYPSHFCGEPDNEPTCQPMRPASVNGSTIYSGVPSGGDSDGDGIDDAADNCPTVFNPVRPMDNGVQADFDADGQGDACDECPLDADATTCSGYDPNDQDADGIPNAEDNCPTASNAAQTDGDGDMKGDACDDCPMDSNPGNQGCPATILEIKTGMASGTVAVNNTLVTACADGEGFWMQMKAGDEGYVDAANSGIFVYDPTVTCGNSISIGDRVSLNPATVGDFFGQVQLSQVTVTVDASAGEALPPFTVLTPAQAGGDTATEYEGVLVEVQNTLVTELNPEAGPGDSDPTSEFVLDGDLKVDDFLYLVDPLPAVGSPFATARGVLAFRNGSQKLLLREAADLVPGAPVLVGFGPEPAFVRVGDTGVATIPEPLTVTLSSPAQGATVVNVVSGNTGALDVNGTVTIPDGQTTATVLLDGVAQATAVTLTATLDTAMLTADVRVVGGGETPSVVSVEPDGASVAPNGTLPMTVTLDIPPTASTMVALSLNPATFGTVPANATVAADQIVGSFDFTALTMEGAETLTATLNGTAQATVNVVSGAPLIINEVDYDQVGGDTMEFVELLNKSGTTLDLTDLELVFINGSNDGEYERIALSSAGTLAAGEYLVIGSAALNATLPMGTKSIDLPGAQDNIQNGAPDGIGIVDTAAGAMVDVLSYEGEITAATVMGVAGTVNFVEGTATVAGDNNTDDISIIRDPNGTDTDDASVDWKISSGPTPGAANQP